MLISQRMKKVDILIVKKMADIVAEEIVKFGDFEAIEVSGEKAKRYLLTKESEDVYIHQLMELEKRVNYLMASFSKIAGSFQTASISVSKDMNLLREDEIEENIKSIGNEMLKYYKEMENLKKENEDLEIKITKLNFFSSYKEGLKKINDLEHFSVWFGAIPVTNYDGFVSAMQGIPSTIYSVKVINNNHIILFSAASSVRDKVEQILKNVYFKDYGLPYEAGKDEKSQLIHYAFQLSTNLDQELWMEKKLTDMALKNLAVLQNIKKSIRFYMSRLHLKEEMAFTGMACLFSGWVPASQVKKLRENIERITENKCVFLEQSASEVIMQEGLTPPTKLSNPRILRPFERLVSIFGIPGYSEIDPTIIAAISYVIMYGAMFGDIGHGLAIAFVGILILLIKKFKAFKNFGILFLFIGISSAVFGLLYGEIFGYDILRPIWLRPLSHIMDILTIAIIFGAFMISLGIIISIINNFMEKNFAGLFFSVHGVAGLVFYWSLLYLGYSVLSKKGLPSYFWLIPSFAVLLIIFEKKLERLFSSRKAEQEEENTGVFFGFMEVFESSLSFLSNTVSFMRVGAFVLNHSALMSVVFIISSMSKNPIIRWFIILLGNIIVIGFEGFIVAIQALRLEYYEFFSKFFKTSGRSFEGLGIYKNQS